MQTGDRFECSIEKVVFGGDGFSRAPDGTAVFIPRVLPGERVIVEVNECKRDFCRAEVLRRTQTAPDRIEPVCPLYGRCVGCDYQHVAYTGELHIKQRQMLDQLGTLFPEAEGLCSAPCAAPEELGYRNKLVLHARKAGKIFTLGYVGEDNVGVVDVQDCFLAAQPIRDELAARRADPGFVHSLHDGMRLTLRYESETGKVHLFRNNPDPKASWLKERLPFGVFSVPLGSFFQVNVGAAALLAEQFGALVAAQSPSLVLDLYCGSGFFGCAAAAAGAKCVRGVEIDPAAVACARFNLQRFPAVEADFVAQDAAKELKKCLKNLPKNALAVVDPPRGGLSAIASSALAESELNKLCYVSCNASTLARDAAKFRKAGFRLKQLRLFDLFPRTRHFEVFSYFER